MKIAAIQMTARPGDVSGNCEQAERLVNDAFRNGAEWAILPEFFTSAMAFHPAMLSAARRIDGAPMRLLKDLARKHNGVVGGSFIALRDGEAYNTFVLAFPDGSAFTHDKDQPTMWENCYYLAGTDDGILGTPAGKIGAALCWEFIRSRTAARMAGKVDMVVGGSCWWTLPERRLPGFPARLKEQNLAIMKDTPRRLARMLGVPVVHAAHAGEFRGRMPLLPGFPFKSYLLGETQIVAPDGEVLVRMAREEGAGFVMADIEPGAKAAPREPVPDRFWIPDLPWQLRFVWWYQNLHGRWYYRWRTRPYRRREAASSL